MAVAVPCALSVVRGVLKVFAADGIGSSKRFANVKNA